MGRKSKEKIQKLRQSAIQVCYRSGLRQVMDEKGALSSHFYTATTIDDRHVHISDKNVVVRFVPHDEEGHKFKKIYSLKEFAKFHHVPL